MLKMENGQLTLWDALLPEPMRKLPEELAKIDELLDDPALLQPFKEAHPSRRGRPTVPVETYLRLMYLKHRYNLGYETLVQEVADSLTWRRFCRIDLDAKVPDSTTLIKARQRYGDRLTDRLNETLLLSLKEKQVLKKKEFAVPVDWLTSPSLYLYILYVYLEFTISYSSFYHTVDDHSGLSLPLSSLSVKKYLAGAKSFRTQVAA